MRSANDQARSRALWCSTAMLVVAAVFGTQMVLNRPNNSQTFQLGAVYAYMLMIGAVPAIVALIARFRRPRLVLAVCVPDVLFSLLGSFGSRRIKQDTLSASPTPAVMLDSVAKQLSKGGCNSPLPLAAGIRVKVLGHFRPFKGLEGGNA